jgi:hypothetical protein
MIESCCKYKNMLLLRIRNSYKKFRFIIYCSVWIQFHLWFNVVCSGELFTIRSSARKSTWVSFVLKPSSDRAYINWRGTEIVEGSMHSFYSLQASKSFAENFSQQPDIDDFSFSESAHSMKWFSTCADAFASQKNYSELHSRRCVVAVWVLIVSFS